jgi:hypothetical protein
MGHRWLPARITFPNWEWACCSVHPICTPSTTPWADPFTQRLRCKRCNTPDQPLLRVRNDKVRGSNPLSSTPAAPALTRPSTARQANDVTIIPTQPSCVPAACPGAFKCAIPAWSEALPR